MSNYSTGEIAKLCGVSVRTVQYYDTRGILVPSALTEGGRRVYSESDLDRMKIICFLRELDLSISTISELMREENSAEVISLILSEQAKSLKEEIEQKQEKLRALEELQAAVRRSKNFSVETIGDVAHTMKNKESVKKIHSRVFLAAVPLGVVQWGSIILWIVKGDWRLFALYVLLAIPYIALLFRYYCRKIAYICPQCHKVFCPNLREAFFANHTLYTRKLTCTCCGYKGFCVETAAEAE